MNGWVRIYRSLADHPIWMGRRFTPGQAWVDLIMLANFHDGKVLQGSVWIPVLRGQVFTSQLALAKRWHWNRKTVRGFLKALNLDNVLDIQTSNRTDTGYTLLTLLNYDKYQGADGDGLDTQTDITADTQTDSQGTVSGHLS